MNQGGSGVYVKQNRGGCHVHCANQGQSRSPAVRHSHNCGIAHPGLIFLIFRFYLDFLRDVWSSLPMRVAFSFDGPPLTSCVFNSRVL